MLVLKVPVVPLAPTSGVPRNCRPVFTCLITAEVSEIGDANGSADPGIRFRVAAAMLRFKAIWARPTTLLTKSAERSRCASDSKFSPYLAALSNATWEVPPLAFDTMITSPEALPSVPPTAADVEAAPLPLMIPLLAAAFAVAEPAAPPCPPSAPAAAAAAFPPLPPLAEPPGPPAPPGPSALPPVQLEAQAGLLPPMPRLFPPSPPFPPTPPAPPDPPPAAAAAAAPLPPFPALPPTAAPPVAAQEPGTEQAAAAEAEAVAVLMVSASGSVLPQLWRLKFRWSVRATLLAAESTFRL